jgi:hypothetical protein
MVMCGLTVGAQVPISGRLAGTVENESGVAQPNAKVTLTYKGAAQAGTRITPQTRSTTTNSAGLFVIDQIEPGVYELSVELPLFEPVTTDIEILTARAKIVSVVLGRRSRVAIAREVEIDRGYRAEVISTLEFQVGTDVKEPVVNTRDATLGGSFEPERITALPLDGRNYLDLLSLLPGVLNNNGGEGFGIFNGTRGTAQNFTLDGTENTDADVALPSLFEDGAVALDSIQEFRLITSNASAEYGRNSGGQVSLFVKRGGNDFHGLVYEYFTHDKLNARNFFDLDPQFADRGLKPPALRHQFGANVGGPLVNDRHFFFAGYEGFRNREGLPRSPRVPTMGTRRIGNEVSTGLIDELEGQFLEGFVELDPAGFPVGSLPSPLLVAMFKRAYPRPTRPLIGPNNQVNPNVGIFDTTIPFSNDTDSFIIRTDHQVTNSNRLHVRYALSNGDESIVGNGLPGTGAGKDFRTQNVSLVNTQILGNNQVNEVRFGFSRNRVDFPTAQPPPAIQALRNLTLHDVIPAIPPDPMRRTFAQLYPGIRFGEDNSSINGFPYFIFPNGTLANFGVDSLNFPQGRARNTFQIGDTYSIVTGRHAIRAGVDVRRLQQNSVSGFNLRPSFLLPDYPFGEVGSLEGLFSDSIISGQQNFFFTKEGGFTDFDGDGIPNGPIIRGLRSAEYGFFIQDNIKLTRRLTLDAGLRYEIFGREGEANDFLSRAVNYRFSPFSQNGTLAPDFAVRQFGSDIGSKVRSSDMNNFGPRLGLAWDPFGDGKMAVRATYGIYYDHLHGTSIFPSQLNPPGVLGYVIPFFTRTAFGFDRPTRIGEVRVRMRDGRLFQLDETGNPVLDDRGNPVTLPLPVSIIDPRFRDSYVQRWNLTIQRELDKDTFVEVSYVGSKGTRLPRARMPNLGPFVIDPRSLEFIYFDGESFHRPNRAFDVITVQESSASSIFHSFQLHLQRRLSRGLSFQAAYTVGKSIDDVSGNVMDAGRGDSIFPQNSFDLSAERGRSAFDVRQRLVINYLYDLPFGPGRRFLGSVGGLEGRLLEGWSVSGITLFQTGFPLTLLAGYDVNEDGVLNDRAFLVPGRSLEDLRVPGGGKNGNTRFFRDPTGGNARFCDINGVLNVHPFPCSRSTNILTTGRSAFFLDPRSFLPGYLDPNGTLLRPFDPNLLLGRGVLTGPGRHKFDVALRKVTRLDNLREGLAIEFRAEFFNIFNRTNFADPEVVITSPQFGEITATSTSSRQVQLALKISF